MSAAITNNFFSCSETPIKLTSDDLTSIRRQGTVGSKVRITSNVAGTGHILPTSQGIAFDLPQTTLEFNSVRHTCYGCLLSIPAMHFFDISETSYQSRKGSDTVQVRIPRMRDTDLSGAELHLNFKGETSATSNSYYTLVIPIRVGNEGVGVDFFASLGQLQRSRPTFGSLMTEDTPLVMYKGTSLDGRTIGSAGKCKDDVSTVFYLLALKPLVMRGSDLARFKTRLDAGYQGPVKATLDIPSAKRPLISYIERILVTAPITGKKYIQNGYVETEQVKCRPLDMSRDIMREGTVEKVFVGGPGEYKTLRNELQDAADFSKSLEDPEVTADVSRWETILAIVLGSIIGLIVIAVVVWYMQKKEGGYAKVTAMMAKLGQRTRVADLVPSVDPKSLVCGSKN